MTNPTELWKAHQECERVGVLGPWCPFSKGKTGTPPWLRIPVRGGPAPEAVIGADDFGFRWSILDGLHGREMSPVAAMLATDRALIAEGKALAYPVLGNCHNCQHNGGDGMCEPYRREWMREADPSTSLGPVVSWFACAGNVHMQDGFRPPRDADHCPGFDACDLAELQRRGMVKP